MWMPPHTTRPPLRTARSAAGTSAPTGANRIAASSGSGGCSSEPPAQDAPSAREALRGLVARPGEGEELTPLKRADLRHDMRGGAKAVETDPLAQPRRVETAPADQPRAKQRRGADGIAVGGELEDEGGLGDEMRGVAAVAGVAGELGMVAKILAPVLAIGAMPAGVGEPGNPDPFADGEAFDAGAEPLDETDDLVAGNDRQPLVGQLAVDHVQIGAANAAGLDADQHFGAPRRGLGPLFEDQRRADFSQRHRAHHRGAPNATSEWAPSADASSRG
jgi:hypothetical protein